MRGPPHQPPPHQPQSSELYYQDPRPPYDTQPYQPASNYYTSTMHHHKPCMARFLRSSHVLESSLPPSMAPPYSEQHPSFPPPRERAGPSPYGPPPASQYGPLAPAHGGYAPLYDSRRMWRPQLYHREDARSNSLPPEVLHSSVYQPPLRERYASLDSPYCSAGEHRAALHRDSYGRVPLGYEDLFKRKQEQWTHHHHGNMNRPSQSSPVFTVDFGAEHDSGGDQCMNCKYRGEERLAHYSPWSCGTISTCISPFEPEHHNASAHSCSEHSEVDNGERKRWLHTFEPYRRLKDEDPIIPFGEGPIISKWGAISRASRTGYHTTDPVQATACQGSNSTTPVDFRDYGPHTGHGDYRWSSCGSDSSSHSSFLESDQLGMCELSARERSFGSGEKAGAGGLLLTDYCKDTTESEPDRDIELELSALDMEDIDLQDNSQHSEESLELRDPHLLTTPSSEPQRSQTDKLSADKMEAHLLKKMAFRKSLSPAGLGSGGLSVGKLMMRTGPPRLGDMGPRPNTGPEMLLNGS